MKRERAVWNDEEDEVISTRPKTTKSYGSKKADLDYHGSLRAEFQSVFGSQKWATKKADDFTIDEEDSDFETFLASTSVANAITRLRNDQVRMRRRQDLNIDARSTCGAVSSLSWQPLGSQSIEANPLVAFATMSDKQVRLCRVSENGKSSNIEYSIQVKKLVSPKVIKFISESELLITNHIKNGRVLLYNIESQSSYSYTSLAGKSIVDARHIVNMPNEKNIFTIAYDGGHIVNIDKRSKQFISEFRLNNACVGLGWGSIGSLYLGDEKSNLYKFDPRSSKCQSRVQLETTVSLSSFAMNGDSLMACGSPFGTVDIVDTYDMEKSTSPIVSFDRLVTGIDNMAFHPIHNSMLVAASADKRNALRVYECGNGKTLQGWPSETEPIGRARQISFSDCGRFLAIGCKSGRVQMYAVQY